MLGKGCARDPKTRQEKRKQSTNVTTRTHRLTLAHFPTYPQSSSSTSPKKRHLDRSCSQFHREQQWRAPRICLCRCRCLCLFFCLPSPEGNLRLSLFVFSLPFSTAGDHHQTIQSKPSQSHLIPQSKADSDLTSAKCWYYRKKPVKPPTAQNPRQSCINALRMSSPLSCKLKQEKELRPGRSFKRLISY